MPLRTAPPPAVLSMELARFPARTLAVFAIGTVCVISCTRDPVVARVGDYEIRKSDVELKDKVTRYYYPAETRSLGQEQLIQTFVNAQILKNHARGVTESDLKKEEERIDQHTIAPEKLEQIKQIFGGDKERYRRVFVLPTLVDRVIYYDFFLKDDEAQEKAKQKAVGFLQSVKTSPNRFSEMAKQKGFQITRLKVSLKGGVQAERPELPNEHPAPPMPEMISQKFKKDEQHRVSEEGQRWIEEMIRPQRPGEVLPSLIDTGENWLAVRYLSPMRGTKDTYQLEAVGFPKADYAQWLTAERSKVTITKP